EPGDGFLVGTNGVTFSALKPRDIGDDVADVGGGRWIVAEPVEGKPGKAHGTVEVTSGSCCVGEVAVCPRQLCAGADLGPHGEFPFAPATRRGVIAPHGRHVGTTLEA